MKKIEDDIENMARLERISMIAQTSANALEEYIQRKNPSRKRLEMLIHNRRLLEEEFLRLFEFYSYGQEFREEDVREIDRAYRLSWNAHIPVSIEEQRNSLQRIFPERSFSIDESIGKLPLPRYAEAYVIIPHYSVFASSYQLATEQVIQTLLRMRGHSRQGFPLPQNLNGQYFYNGNLRGHREAKEPWKERWNSHQEKYNTFIVPFQAGARHVGRSARRSREIMEDNEVWFGVYATAIVLLTHPQRLSCETRSGFVCLGDELTQDEINTERRKMRRFNQVVSIEYADGIRIGSFELQNTIATCGAFTGFL